MRILYLSLLLFFSNNFSLEMINSQEIDKEISNKINQFKSKENNVDTKNSSKADFVLKNIPRIEIDQLKNKVDTDIDIFALENIRGNTEFLAPDALTFPDNLFPPLTTILSMLYIPLVFYECRDYSIVG